MVPKPDDEYVIVTSADWDDVVLDAFSDGDDPTTRSTSSQSLDEPGMM